MSMSLRIRVKLCCVWHRRKQECFQFFSYRIECQRIFALQNRVLSSRDQITSLGDSCYESDQPDDAGQIDSSEPGQFHEQLQ